MTVHDRRLLDESTRAETIPPAQPRRRRVGIVATIVQAIAAWAERRADRRAKRPRRSGRAPPVPHYLRQDVGLPPLPPKLPDWWEGYY